MIWCSDDRARRNADAGFTLLEVLVVLAVLGMALTLFAVRGNPVSPAVQARAAARDISEALRAAHAEAVATNRSIFFVIDVANRDYRWGREAPHTVPPGVRLALLTSRDELVTSSVGKIRFDPDGGASGGRVTVDGGGRAWWVGVDWLSGRVSVVQKGGGS
jgi:general secretion pathway protein H